MSDSRVPAARRRHRASPSRPWRALLGTTTLLGAAGLAYSAGYEVRAFRLREVTAPVLPAGSQPLRVLHISDLHLTPSRRETVRWVQGLAALQPDLVVNTGDNLAHGHAGAVALEALEPLLAFPGVYVRGSNDYFAPRLKNPARYLLGPSKVDPAGRRIDTESFISALVGFGWLDLRNRTDSLTLADGRRVAFAGVDDPHLQYDDYPSGPADPTADVRIGVAHAPYLRVLNAMTVDGYDLLLAGHTHGGQLNLPFYGPLVSNCDLPPRYAKGLHEWSAGERTSWLNVSAGLGTSPFTPVRFCCHPEASLLTLTCANR